MFARLLAAYGRWVVRHRWTVLAAVFATTVLLGRAATHLHVEVDPDRQLPQDHPFIQTLNDVHRIFGDKNLVVVGLFPHAQYRNQTIQLQRGDALVLFTDGVTEAENAKEEQLGLTTVADMLKALHCADATKILAAVDEHVHAYIGETPPGDDVTMLAVTRCA